MKCCRASGSLRVWQFRLRILPHFCSKIISSRQCVSTFCLECLRISLCIIREPEKKIRVQICNKQCKQAKAKKKKEQKYEGKKLPALIEIVCGVSTN